jgi:hypothetical protein
VRLAPYDDYSDDDKTFVGTHAEYLKPKPWDTPTQNVTDQEDPDADIDPDNILEKQSFNEITFDKSQILKKNGPLVHPNDVLCSDTLRDSVSFYA